MYKKSSDEFHGEFDDEIIANDISGVLSMQKLCTKCEALKITFDTSIFELFLVHSSYWHNMDGKLICLVVGLSSKEWQSIQTQDKQLFKDAGSISNVAKKLKYYNK